MDDKIFERIITWLETIYEDYKFTVGDFELVMEDEGIVITGWTLDEPVPNMDFIKSIKLPEEVVVLSLEERVQRLEKLSGIQ